MTKVKVFLTDDSEEIILADKDTLEELECEMSREKAYMSEYKTTSGRIIIDIDIERIEI